MPETFDWWEAHLARISTRPSRTGLAAVARAVSRGSKPVRSRRLGGGIATATSVVRIRTRSGRTLDVVLKRFPRSNEACVLEWNRISFAERLPVPSPVPIALDAEGEWFGQPALVMSKVAGRPEIAPRRLDVWLDDIAASQVAIHSASTRRLPAAMTETIPDEIYGLPNGLRRTPLVERAVAVIRKGLRRAKERDIVVAHGDPHPGNLLWSRGRLSGIADWGSARLFPRGREVAYMRTDIAVLLGVQAADGFLERYESLLGRPVRDLAVWDLVQGVNATRWVPLWAFAYREQGSAMTDQLARRRATAFVRHVLARST